MTMSMLRGTAVLGGVGLLSKSRSFHMEKEDFRVTASSPLALPLLHHTILSVQSNNISITPSLDYRAVSPNFNPKLRRHSDLSSSPFREWGRLKKH
jgi:hypothetical protein